MAAAATIADILDRIRNNPTQFDEVFGSAGVEEVLAATSFSQLIAEAVGKSLDNFVFSSDIAIDRLTEEQIAYAALFMIQKMIIYFGRIMGLHIFEVYAQKLYVNGQHSFSSKKAWYKKPSALPDDADEDDVFQATIRRYEALSEEQRASPDSAELALNARWARSGVSGKHMKEFYAQHLKEHISKTMIVRIHVRRMKIIHGSENAAIKRNVFMDSIRKYKISLENNSCPSEWLFFGANLHPDFYTALSEGAVNDYMDLREAIFMRANESREGGDGENRGVWLNSSLLTMRTKYYGQSAIKTIMYINVVNIK